MRWISAGLTLILLAGCSMLQTKTDAPLPAWNTEVSVTQPTLRWKLPPAQSSWQWDLGDSPDLSIVAEVWDLDLFDTSAETVQQLHAQDRYVICYLNAGSWEDWRSDAGDFPVEVIGRNYAGWPGEKWLDIRKIDLLAPLLQSRLNLCRDKGFNGVEPDNIDGYQNNTGFLLSAADQLAFNRWLAEEAHARGLSIGLKNDPDQARELLVDFDWVLAENCFSEGWCEDLLPFVESGKAVFAVEYTNSKNDFASSCQQAQKMGINLIKKNINLDTFRQTCP